jgi:hypothetical protein
MAIESNHFVRYTSDALWDPFKVLKIPNLEYGGGVTCLGHARKASRRCRNPVNQSNRSRASNILEYISEQLPQYSQLRSSLEDLAGTCLCLRWHTPSRDPPQLTLLLAKWRKALDVEWKRYKAEELSKSLDQQDSEPEPSCRRLAKPANLTDDPFTHPDRKALPLSEPATDLTPYVLAVPTPPPATNGSSFLPLTTTRVSHESNSHNKSTTPTAKPQNTSNLPVTPSTAPSAPDVDTDVESPRVSISPPESIRRPTATLSITDAPAGSCHSSHAKRRNLYEDCIICKESCLEVPFTGLTWCKTCGHNMHKACFEEWRPWAESSRAGLRCALWYVIVQTSAL